MATQYLTLLAKLNETERALAGSIKVSSDAALQAKFVEKFGAARVAQVNADTVVYESNLRAEIATLSPQVDAERAISCDKCQGTGQYNGPTSRTRRGIPYCFDCNGSGRS